MKRDFFKFPKGRLINRQFTGFLQGTIAIMIFSMFFFPARAEAYLDPSTGSLIIQIILGGIAGLATIFKLYGSKIKGLFSNKTKKEAK